MFKIAPYGPLAKVFPLILKEVSFSFLVNYLYSCKLEMNGSPLSNCDLIPVS